MTSPDVDPFARSAQMSVTGMRAQAMRLQIVAENMANAETYGYRRKMLSFEGVFNASRKTTPTLPRMFLDQRPGEQIFDPGHPLSDEQGYLTTSNVDLMIELADAREANRSYEAGLELFNHARSMYRALMDVIKR